MMKIYPAIDLIDGAVVRLTKGDYAQKTTFSADPLAVAQGFAAAGARYLHVIDLDGAKNPHKRQLDLVKRIAGSTSLSLQVGGGIRSYAEAKELCDAGVTRVILGSIAITNPAETRRILTGLGSTRVTLGVDVKINAEQVPMVATAAWQTIEKQSAFMLLDYYRGLGLDQVLCTDIDRDGTGAGPNFELYATLLRKYPEICLLASGGVASIADIHELHSLGASGVGGVVIGKSLYEGRFTLKEALSC